MTYDDCTIDYRITYSKRRTLAIHVHSDGSVEVRAPKRTSLKKIEHTVALREKWIAKQQQYFAQLPPAPAKRLYVTGETFPYLGNHYPLKVERGLRNLITLDDHQLYACVTRTDPKLLKTLIGDWYRAQAKTVFDARFPLCLELAQQADIRHSGDYKMRMMKSRWGSCTSRGSITLNQALIAAPIECIDYVIIHELCHLIEANHSKWFYALMASILPDWKSRRTLLNKTVRLPLL